MPNSAIAAACPLCHVRNDLEAEDPSSWPDDLPDQRSVPSGSGSQLEHGVTGLQLKEVEHAEHERGLGDRGRDVLVIVTEEDDRFVGVERGQMLVQV